MLKGLPLRAWSFALLYAAYSVHATDVIVNESVSAQQLKRSDVREIFSANRQYWADGEKISVYVLAPNSAAHKRFCREILQMFPYQLERLWNQITYSGQGEPPIIVNSEQQLIELVSTTPGAIGYVNDSTTKLPESSKRISAL